MFSHTFTDASETINAAELLGPWMLIVPGRKWTLLSWKPLNKSRPSPQSTNYTNNVDVVSLPTTATTCRRRKGYEERRQRQQQQRQTLQATTLLIVVLASLSLCIASARASCMTLNQYSSLSCADQQWPIAKSVGEKGERVAWIKCKYSLWHGVARFACVVKMQNGILFNGASSAGDVADCRAERFRAKRLMRNFQGRQRDSKWYTEWWSSECLGSMFS